VISLIVQIVGWIILFTVIIGGGAAVNTAVTEASASASADSAQGAQDVAVTDCKMGDFGTATATLTITNSSDSPKSYLVTVSGNDDTGARLSEMNAAANTVGAGQTATVDALGSVTSGTVTQCVVANVNRF